MTATVTFIYSPPDSMMMTFIYSPILRHSSQIVFSDYDIHNTIQYPPRCISNTFQTSTWVTVTVTVTECLLKQSIQMYMQKRNLFTGQNEREESTQNTTVTKKCCVCKLQDQSNYVNIYKLLHTRGVWQGRSASGLFFFLSEVKSDRTQNVDEKESRVTGAPSWFDLSSLESTMDFKIICTVHIGTRISWDRSDPWLTSVGIHLPGLCIRHPMPTWLRWTIDVLGDICWAWKAESYAVKQYYFREEEELIQ